MRWEGYLKRSSRPCRKCEPIPETHLSLCQVNAGAHGTFQICCGADNVKAGGKYPLALIGATVYATARITLQ